MYNSYLPSSASLVLKGWGANGKCRDCVQACPLNTEQKRSVFYFIEKACGDRSC